MGFPNVRGFRKAPHFSYRVFFGGTFASFSSFRASCLRKIIALNRSAVLRNWRISFSRASVGELTYYPSVTEAREVTRINRHVEPVAHRPQQRWPVQRHHHRVGEKRPPDLLDQRVPDRRGQVPLDRLDLRVQLRVRVAVTIDVAARVEERSEDLGGIVRGSRLEAVEVEFDVITIEQCGIGVVGTNVGLDPEPRALELAGD